MSFRVRFAVKTRVQMGPHHELTSPGEPHQLGLRVRIEDIQREKRYVVISYPQLQIQEIIIVEVFIKDQIIRPKTCNFPGISN